MSVLALISDLMMQSQVTGAASRTGTSVSIANSTGALLEKAAAAQPKQVILDLSHPGLDPQALVPELRGVLPAGATILAVGPHVHKDRLAGAAAAGCDTVISRGQFHASVDEILRGED